MIITPFALWFVVGAIVAVYSLVDDFFISKNLEVIRKVIEIQSEEFISVPTMVKLMVVVFITIDVLLGPLSIYFFYRKTKKMKALKKELGIK